MNTDFVTAGAIVTHPGPAHRDEFVACSLLLAEFPSFPIFRREPTAEDLADPDVLVVDVGGKFDLGRNNLDHHQLERDAAPCCSITQVLRYLAVDLAKAREIWGWLQPSEVLDSKGPYALAGQLSMKAEDLFRLQSPVEMAVLEMFSKCSAVAPGDVLHKLMTEVGKHHLGYYAQVTYRLSELAEKASFTEVGGMKVLDSTFIPGNESPSLGIEMFLKADPNTSDVDVVVSRDDRGTGLTLFRRGNSPKVDFSQLEGRDQVVFAHKGGFIAKVKHGAPWRDLVYAARTGV
jgi:hypothetical protein